MKLFAVTALIASAIAGAAMSQSVIPPTRVEKLLSQMTRAEKITMIHGTPEDASTSQGQPGFVAGVPRLGIPPLRLVDGPNGVLTKVWSTGMPSTMALAATFSVEDAKLNGDVIGGDARALGQDIVLEPFLNLSRDFKSARAYNTYGEDPVLTGQIGAAVVTGIQSHGVMSAAKHYTAFDGATNVIVDAQTLHEMYVAPFADAVAAGIASILCSSNTINGPYSCGSGATLNSVLKTELEFKGFVIPDFEGTHSTLYINEGLDLEMPGGVEGVRSGRGGYFLAGAPPPPATGNAPAGVEAPIGMLHAIETGQVQEATINAAVSRILGQMERFGYLDKPPSHSVTAENTVYNNSVIEKTAEDAAVLLKNNDRALPLTPGELNSVAFIGPGAAQIVAIGLPGGKGAGIPASQIGPLAAMEQIAGHAVKFAVANDMTGSPIPQSALAITRTNSANNQTQSDADLNFTVANNRALAPGSSWTWAGTLNIPADGSYMIALQALGAAGTVTLDGKPILRMGNPGPGRVGAILHPNQDNVLPTTDGLDNPSNFFTLHKGTHELRVTAVGEKAGHPVQIRLAWVTPEQQLANYQAAIDAAKHARKAVVFAWGRDRPEAFRLAGDQDKLISDIAAVNPNTIVVLNTSLPVAMPWLGQVKSVLEMWWTGDRGGPATANILLGRANPAGRLPFTWPQSLEQMVANDPSHPERSSKGVDGKTTYSEGLFMGYRWFDRQNIAPLFPFGAGLSYTSFVYSKPKTTYSPDGGMDVTFTLRNTGKMSGDEVPQVYLGPPAQAPANVQFVVKALAAFDRVRIAAGQSKRVTLHIPLRRLRYWSAPDSRWVVPNASRPVYIAASSRDIRFTLNTSNTK